MREVPQGFGGNPMLSRHFAASVAAGALAAAFFAPAAYAQQTTASLRGVAVDDAGAPIAGVSVTIVHKPSGTKTTLVTDAAGVFDARGLRVGGPYTVLGKAPKLQDQTLNDIYLTVGDAGRVTLNFSAATEVAAVTVSGKKKSYADLANVGSRTTLKAADIEQVVTVKRDIRDVARRDPLAQLDFVARGTGPSGGLYIAGSSPRRNRITIDGVRSQDDYGLNTGGLSTNRGPVSLEAIEQIAVQATPFDVEDGDFTGGALNMILKSGGNDFHGSVFDLYRTPRLLGNKLQQFSTATNPDGTIRVLQSTAKIKNYVHDTNYGAFLSGPIIQDRLFFAVSYEKYSSFDVTAAGPAGLGFGTLFNKIPGISTGANATAADVNTVLANWNNYAASATLKPGQVDLVQPVNDEKSSIKLDYNLTDTQRISASYRHAFSSVAKRSPSATTFSLDTNWYSQPENEDNYAIQLNSKWSPELTTEARVSYRGYQRGQLPPEGQGFANFSICTDALSAGSTTSCTSGTPSISFGPDQFRQANVLKTTDLAGSFTADYRFMDTHQLKLGYQFKGIHIYNLFVQNARGSYYFDSVADFATGKANSYSYGNALTGTASDAAARFSYKVQTLFAQDTWDLSPGLTVNYGLRYDFYTDDVKPALNANFVNRYGFNNQQTYDGMNVLMPRFSAKWRTETFELSGGIGLVSGGIPDVFIGNSYGAQTGALNNSFSVVRNANGTFTNTSTGAALDTATGQALLNLNQANASLATTPSATAQSLVALPSQTQRLAFTNSMAPGFEMPADWKANLSFKTSRWNWDFGIDAVATWSETNIAFRDIRARRLIVNGQQALTPDGRIRYDGLQIAGATPAAINAQRVLLGLNTSPIDDLANVGSNGDIQAYNPHEQNWNTTVAFSAGTKWKNLDLFASYVVQDGKSFGGISEFGTTEGGNSNSGNYYADQVSGLDPNTSVKGRATNLIDEAFKFQLGYKHEFIKGWESRFTLFGESRSGRPITFLMSDPRSAAGGFGGGSSSRGQVFGVYRDDQLLYVPNLSSPDALNPLKFTSPTGTTVYFANAAALAQFRSLVQQFNLPQGRILPKGVGQNPRVNRIDFQYAQDIPGPLPGHHLLFTVDIANLGNLINKKWGVIKEYSNSRAGAVLVNASCGDATGAAPTAANPAACQSYVYSYTNANAVTQSKPTIVDQTASLWQIELGLKYKF